MTTPVTRIRCSWCGDMAIDGARLGSLLRQLRAPAWMPMRAHLVLKEWARGRLAELIGGRG